MLSRIKERYHATGDTQRPSPQGLAASAKTISSAALIMVAVFAIFAGTGVPQVKEIGVGLAVAIALDATVVRLVLVPTTMQLMGDFNWWLPKWLDRRLPDMDFESSRPPKQEEVVTARMSPPRRPCRSPVAPRASAGRPPSCSLQRLQRLRDRSPDRVDRRPRGGRLQDAGARRHERGVDARRRRTASRRGRSTRSSTTRASRTIGAIESLPMDRVRGFFETNVFGPVRLIAARAAEHARGAARAGGHRRLDERQVHLARHGLLLRHQARAGGDPRRPAPRDAPVRRSSPCCWSRGSSRRRWARPRSGRRVEDPDEPYAEYNAAVAESRASYTTGARASWPAPPRPWPRRSSRR